MRSWPPLDLRATFLENSPFTIKGRRGLPVAFELPTSAGTVRLTKAGAGWAVCFSGKTRGRWRSPEAAARAVAQHHTGFPEWDREYLPVSEDIIDWRPLGKSI